MRNVKRDARRILNFQPRHEVLFSTIENTALAPAAEGEEPQMLEDVLPSSRQPRPDEEAVANELEKKVRTAVKPLPNGEACFDAMLEQEPTADTAARLGITVHQVLRTRDYIRRRARLALA